MSPSSPSSIPNTLDEAIETLLAYYAQDIPTIRTRTEDEFLALAHFAAGTFMRSTWCLFWNEENRHPAWPVEKPALVQWFHDQGIKDADDMSEEILRMLWKEVQQIK